MPINEISPEDWKNMVTGLAEAATPEEWRWAALQERILNEQIRAQYANEKTVDGFVALLGETHPPKILTVDNGPRLLSLALAATKQLRLDLSRILVITTEKSAYDPSHSIYSGITYFGKPSDDSGSDLIVQTMNARSHVKHPIIVLIDHMNKWNPGREYTREELFRNAFNQNVRIIATR